MNKIALGILVSALVAGCGGGGSGNDTAAAGDNGGSATGDDGSGSAGGDDGGSAAGGDDGSGTGGGGDVPGSKSGGGCEGVASGANPQAPVTIDPNDRVSVCRAYVNVLVPAVDTPVGWSGDVASCAPGAPSAASKAATFAAINYFRAMAGLDAITENPVASSEAQATALVQLASGFLSHSLSASQPCYTADAALGAGRSNLSLGYRTGAAAIVGQIADGGASNYFVGHRRWLLKPETTTMGIGTVGTASTATAVEVFGPHIAGGGKTIPAAVRYPNAGYFPYEILPQRWSYSANGMDFSKASVTVTKGGVSVGATPVVSSADKGYGWNTVVWTTPALPKPAAGVTDVYRVSIEGLPTAVTYEVSVVAATAR
jgi:uncharacterized protein YkwD